MSKETYYHLPLVLSLSAASKETYKRDLQMSKETYYHLPLVLSLSAAEKVGVSFLAASHHNQLHTKETYKCQKRPTSVKRDLQSFLAASHHSQLY